MTVSMAAMAAVVVGVAAGVAAGPVPAAAGELRATVRNIKPNQGRVMVALFDSDEARRAERPWAGYFVAAAAPNMVVVFADLPPGRYGLVAFQDLDGDGKLEKNLLGIPREPYGFSRNAPARFGPPSFEDSAVTVGASGTAATEILLVE
ncbi:DUF2141 domain-containing protein [Azospirillum picis]|uniref:DUF2141 domain-containing protein n=1 Tax=Azospirillum picis TaxID=488438 RepID=UPI001AE5FA57|nr:DUF2141 domain-containing protein [Azospirillum picis]